MPCKEILLEKQGFALTSMMIVLFNFISFTFKLT